MLALLSACDRNGAQEKSSGTQQANGSAALPPPPPAGTPPDTRFPLPYPHVAVPVYAVGQDVEIEYQGEWVAARVSETAMIDGKQQVRTTYPGQNGSTPHLILSNEAGIRLPSGRIGKDLQIGKYSCFDGASRPDLAFRVPQWGAYSDAFGEKGGQFTTSGDTITFSGGMFDGLTAQQLTSSGFAFTPQATCSREVEF